MGTKLAWHSRMQSNLSPCSFNRAFADDDDVAGKGSQGSQCVQLSRGDAALKPLTHCDWVVVGQSSHSCVLVFRTKASSHSAMQLQPLHRLRGSGVGHSSLSDAASNLLI